MAPTHDSPRRAPLALAFALLPPLLSLPGCVAEVTITEEEELGEMQTGETRTVELRYLRFDAKDYPLTITLDDLKEMPEETLRRTWLLDLDARPLITNALNILINTPPDEIYELGQAEQNMWKLLNLTAHSTKLDGTSLGPLIGVGEVVDIPASIILSDLLGVENNDRLIGVELLTDAVISNVMSTHPNAQRRKGPFTPDHPDGLYEVKYGHIPVSLYDVINGFSDLPEVFGPTPLWEDPGVVHPGFISDTSGLVATTSDFAMTVKANLNALPYEGVDLTTGDGGRLNSIAAQIDTAFDFSDPDWMVVDGLVDSLVIEHLTMEIYESDQFWPGGTDKEPAPDGNSPVWTEVPKWEFERLIMDVAKVRAEEIDGHCTTYTPPQNAEEKFEAVEACIDDGAWVSIDIKTLELPEIELPPPQYFWDILIEVAQVRLHDGGLAEGEGTVELALDNIPTGVTTDELIATMKTNIMTNAKALSEFAKLLNDNDDGDPDFYYYQPNGPDGGIEPDDYLYFVSVSDIRKDEDGQPVREYSYSKPGFFADAALTEKISATTDVDGDTVHEKTKIAPGDILYIEDHAARRFKITVNDKPSLHRISLDIERIE